MEMDTMPWRDGVKNRPLSNLGIVLTRKKGQRRYEQKNALGVV
jgi:hypothetical protein